MPFINDTEDNVGKILENCVRVGVKGIMCFGMGLTLREGDREYYYVAFDKYTGENVGILIPGSV